MLKWVQLLNQHQQQQPPQPQQPDNAKQAKISGSDPRIATCRGKLQNKRSKLNQEINKELRLRAGAENLYKATTNKKLRETVALELSFVNSNLQLLKEQLAELNSSVEVYQKDSTEPAMPMIPLGLKETKEIDFRDPFKDFILEHYSEDSSLYDDAITEFMDIRQAMRTPLRDNSGVSLLFDYYNQLYFVERRFFPPDRSLGIYFEWYDSLTGVPSCQRTVAFEKACVLFNIGAVYTQIGTRQDRKSSRGLDSAVDAFLRAAGTFQYIHESFTNAPSMDLSPDMLDMLVQLMLAQARECLFEKLELQSQDLRDVDVCLDLGQEAAQVADAYSKVFGLISVPSVKDYVAQSWVSLAMVKQEHYRALSHYHVACGLLSLLKKQSSPKKHPAPKPPTPKKISVDANDNNNGSLSLPNRTRDTLQYIHAPNVEDDAKLQIEIRVPKDEAECRLLGRAHLREAVLRHDESQRLFRMCRELRGKDSLISELRRAHRRASELYKSLEEDDDFRDMLDPPLIVASTKFQLSLTPPDFAQFRVQDLFKSLGPVAIFSAKHHWTAPRTIQLVLQPGEKGDGFGFMVRGDAPVVVAGVDGGSLAEAAGMKQGDFIAAIGDEDVKWAVHEHVVQKIKEAKKNGSSLCLKLVTPMDRNYLKPRTSVTSNKGSFSPTSTTSSSSSGVSSGSHSPQGSVTSSRLAKQTSHQKKLTWNPFRNKAKGDEPNGYEGNVILR
ncbi:Hypothetical predicted protein [Cloeon dipterum]|uniref:Rhophilin-2 n=1 Tax=Cloeon dipterum TaxID=197152 RepID=A0A8S1CSD5_9INSE|nr:Hypothetical predicted protein [Cloeon dipterum]